MSKLSWLIKPAREFCDNSSGKWRYIDHIKPGKTADVFKIEGEQGLVALKIFDPSFFANEDMEVQVARINLQKELINHYNDHIIDVLHVGELTDYKTWYILMEYLPWSDLEDAYKKVPISTVPEIIRQIALAAHFLESQKKIVHRDIKPSNILISDDFRAVKLLDLGVLRRNNDSDGSGTPSVGDHRFVATRQYSSPSYLLGHPLPEKDEGASDAALEAAWRALTWYQIGGVLHDLLMRKPLFYDALATRSRQALEIAVATEVPQIENFDADQRLVELARDCLDKDDERRLARVSWDRFWDLAQQQKRTVAAPRPAVAEEHDALLMRLELLMSEIVDMARDALISSPQPFPRHRARKGPVNAGRADFWLSYRLPEPNQRLLCVHHQVSLQIEDGMPIISVGSYISPQAIPEQKQIGVPLHVEGERIRDVIVEKLRERFIDNHNVSLQLLDRFEKGDEGDLVVFVVSAEAENG